MRVTLDANVWLSAVSPREVHHVVCRSVLQALLRNRTTFVQPELFVVEVAATVARRSRDRAEALRAAREALALPGIRVVPGGDAFAMAAVGAAASCAVRGADAVYLATAQLHDTLLITLDAELHARGAQVAQTEMPAGWMASGGPG